jgi:hypothetical protein
MRISNDSVTVASAEGPHSMGASFNSDAIYLGHIVNFSIQSVFTGTPNGSFKLQYSNDKGVEDKTNGGWSAAGISTWTDDAASVIAVTAAGDAMWDVQNSGPRWVRLVWTRTSSTGSATIRFNAKGV